MSTFTSKNGLYERAQKRFKVSDGKKLFSYPFFERQKKEAQVNFSNMALSIAECEKISIHSSSFHTFAAYVLFESFQVGLPSEAPDFHTG